MYVFPVGIVKNVRLISREKFEATIEEGKKKGHTHVKIMRVGYYDQFLPIDSAALENIATNIEGHSVYAVRTGYPVYSNCNRYAYTPYVSGITEKENNSYGAGLMNFINN